MAKLKIQVGKEVSVEEAKEYGIHFDGSVLKSGKIRVSYNNIMAIKEGWIDFRFFMPKDYDIVTVKTTKGRIYPAWWAETKWMGLRKAKRDRIVFWRMAG